MSNLRFSRTFLQSCFPRGPPMRARERHGGKRSSSGITIALAVLALLPGVFRVATSASFVVFPSALLRDAKCENVGNDGAKAFFAARASLESENDDASPFPEAPPCAPRPRPVECHRETVTGGVFRAFFCGDDSGASSKPISSRGISRDDPGASSNAIPSRGISLDEAGALSNAIASLGTSPFPNSRHGGTRGGRFFGPRDGKSSRDAPNASPRRFALPWVTPASSSRETLLRPVVSCIAGV
mmetsp:Transcript_2033/g.7016  ORF Transcript_2033/g.7016 Transcript_2033/m.7016 type:complete len:242 (+) Transcript_2033:1148-1873(+)